MTAPALDPADIYAQVISEQNGVPNDPVGDLYRQSLKQRLGGGDGKRGLAGTWEDVKQFARHPIDSIGQMGDAIAEGLNKANSPVIGMPKGIVTNLLTGKPFERVTAENTPNAVTPREWAGGVGTSAINIGMALAPELAVPLRIGVNAGAGALMNPEDRLRGAGDMVVLGEVFHGASKIAARLRSRPVTATTVANPTPVVNAVPEAEATVSALPSEPLTARDASGKLRKDLSAVPDEHLHNEIMRLTELNASEEAAHSGVQESGYRENYLELPRTERLGAGEDLPDADGEMDPDVLAKHNEIVKGYNRNQMVRAAREKAIGRLQSELASRTPDESPVSETEQLPNDATAFNPAEFEQVVKPEDAQPKQLSLRDQAQNDAVAREAANRLTAPPVLDYLRQKFAPDNRSPSARLAGQIIRRNVGHMKRVQAVAEASLSHFDKVLSKLPETDQLAFIDSYEGGKSQPTEPLRAASKQMRKLYAGAVKAVQDLGTGKLESPLENYMAHIWENPEGARTTLMSLVSKRPMEGSKAFLSRRTITTTREGIEAGLKPVTTNPVRLTLIKLGEMNKYVAAQKILGEFKSNGLVKFVRATEHAPDGHVAIDDRIATVSGPLTSEGARTIRGHYYAPEPVARVLNNYLSPGLRGDLGFRAYMGVGNLINQANLSLSAYHAGSSTVLAGVDKLALGIKQLVAGKPILALKSMGSAATVAGPTIETLVKGNKYLEEYYRPGSQGEDAATVIDGLTRAGGVARMESIYKNGAVDQFLEAIHKKKAGPAARQFIPAALETFAKPIMEWGVPRMKVGVFADLWQHELSQLGESATGAEKDAAAQRIWNSVDNRHGQMVYDNVFVNKTAKDLAMASVRSVGWSGGTIAEVGGGLVDLVQAPKRISRGEPWMTDKLAFIAALPIYVGFLGAVTQYLYTGQRPSELRDYFHPRTGKVNDAGDEERVQLPTYMKDLVAYKNHPVQTVLNKMHPLLSITADMLMNENYYGDEIRNPDDPAVKQFLQEANYIRKAVEPYGVQNAIEERQRGQSLATQGLSFVGITPAARQDVRSPAENLMAEYIKQQTPSGGTPEDEASRDVRREIRELARAGRTASPAVIDAIRSGQLTRRGVEQTARDAMLPPSLVSFRKLDYDKARRVYDLGDPAEQAMWYPALVKKYHNYVATHQGIEP